MIGSAGADAGAAGRYLISISTNTNSWSLALMTSCSTPAWRKYASPAVSSATVSAPSGPISFSQPVLSGTITFTVHFCYQTIAAFDLRDGTVHHAPACGFDGYRWRDTHNSTGATTAIEVQ